MMFKEFTSTYQKYLEKCSLLSRQPESKFNIYVSSN